MKRNQTGTLNTLMEDVRKILRALERQNKMIERLCGYAGRLVNSDARRMRKPRRSNEQMRQLALAMELLKSDPSHNVHGAARLAFRKVNGYKSVNALCNALSNQWNSRVE